MSIDIECDNRPGLFPDAKYDKILDIGIIFGRMNTESNQTTIERRIVLILSPLQSLHAVNKDTSDGDIIYNDDDDDDDDNDDDDGDNLLPNVEYLYCKDEKNMFEQFEGIIQSLDPDYILGYNTDNFDFRYLYERSNIIHVPICDWSRIRGLDVEQEIRDFCSTQIGLRETVITHIAGQASVDLFTFIRSMYKLRSYKLNDVAEHFLRMRKKDVPPNKIS